MTFRRQLIVGIGALIGVMLFCAAMSIATLWTSSEEVTEATARMIDETEVGQRISVGATRLVAASRGYLLTGDERDGIAVAAIERELENVLDELYATGNPIVLAESASVRVAVKQYARAVEQAAVRRRATTDAREIEWLVEQSIAPSRQAVRDAVRRLTYSERFRLHRLSEESGHRLRVTGAILVGGCSAGAVIGLVLAFAVSRRLSGAYAREHEAARAAEQAAAARKEVLEMVSHDLRSPLQSITLGIDVLRARHGELPQLTTIEHAAEHVQRLVEDLLDASQAETTGLGLECSQVPARALLEATEELFASRAAQAEVNIRLGACSDDVITVDRSRILQVLANLVANALSFTPRGGEIVLAATRGERAIKFTVKDTGPGIAEADRARLFDAFEQGREGRRGKQTRRGSVGLGLYIARNLVRAHGGRIDVDSTLGAGSTFWFELPLDDVRVRA